MSSDAVIELLRLEVPATQRQVWLAAEQRTWQPWLEDQDGFLGRDLYWDPQLQQGVLLIRWNSHDQWKAITPEAVEQVQQRFDATVRSALGQSESSEPRSPFPLVMEGELIVQRLPGDD
ncbi:MAG: TIGR03792 family protein [Cyanobium sp. NAT70]|nr:TIGR03792 family protein [Cyanobium sp. NAT70]